MSLDALFSPSRSSRSRRSPRSQWRLRPGVILLAAVASTVAGPSVVAAQVDPDPGPAAAAGVDDTVVLSLIDAVRLAFQNNLDLRVVRYDRSISEERVTEVRGRFEPKFTFGTPDAPNLLPLPGGGGFGGATGAGGFGFSSSELPASSTLTGASVSTTSGWATLLSFGQQTAKGLRYDLGYSLSRTDSNSIFQSFNPSWNNTLTLSVVQPLLRGRGKNGAASTLLVARANVDVSRATLQARVLEVLMQVERAYWEAVFAARNLEVKEQTLALAFEQLERTRAQVEVGFIPPVEQTQAEVAVANRESDLIVARGALGDAHDALRAVLRADQLPAGWQTDLSLTEEPSVTQREMDEAEAVAAALRSRPEIAEARASIATRGVESEAASNALMPKFDLVGAVSWNGIGGDKVTREGFGGPIIDVVAGGYGDAARQLFQLDFLTWRVGVNVSVPVGNREARGAYARATLNQDKARAELVRREQQVVLQVRQALRALDTASQRWHAGGKARELAERQLEIEQARFEVGMTTNFEVLDFQEQLAQARTNELRSLIDYRLAEAELRRSTGSLTDSHGIEVR